MSKQTPRAGSLAYRTSSSTTMVPPFAYRVTRPRTVPLTPTVPPKYTTPFVAGLNPRWRGKRYLASAGRLADTEGAGGGGGGGGPAHPSPGGGEGRWVVLLC